MNSQQECKTWLLHRNIVSKQPCCCGIINRRHLVHSRIQTQFLVMSRKFSLIFLVQRDTWPLSWCYTLLYCFLYWSTVGLAQNDPACTSCCSSSPHHHHQQQQQKKKLRKNRLPARRMQSVPLEFVHFQENLPHWTRKQEQLGILLLLLCRLFQWWYAYCCCCCCCFSRSSWSRRSSSIARRWRISTGQEMAYESKPMASIASYKGWILPVSMYLCLYLSLQVLALRSTASLVKFSRTNPGTSFTFRSANSRNPVAIGSARVHLSNLDMMN